MDLTIAIPTYNRKERLIKQLQSILNQKRSNEISFLIVDNHSKYDVKEELESAFGAEFLKRVDLFINEQNYGLSANLCNLFLKCKTKWMWTLGDDDETLYDSIETVINQILENPNVGMFKFSIEGYTPHDDVMFNNLHDLIGYFAEGRHSTGDLIFLSNNVYNMAKTMPYFKNTISDCYCVIPQLLPVFNGLDNKDFIVKFSSKPIVRYIQPDPETAWNYVTIALNLSIVPLFDYNISADEYVMLGSIMANNFSHKILAFKCLNYNDRKRGLYIYDRIYYSYYYFNGNIKDKFLKLAVHFIIRFNISLNTIRRVKRCFLFR